LGLRLRTIRFGKVSKHKSIDMCENPLPIINTNRRTSIHPRRTTSIVGIIVKALRSTKVKELSRIPMPVDICEPLSHLERMGECMENYSLLDKASQATVAGKELVYVAAFMASSYSSSALRLNKPFNPLLHETYEWDRSKDLGWKLISEQVSHHPPTSAMHVKSEEWEMTEHITLKSSFSLTSISVQPEGCCIITLKNGDVISFKKPETKIKSIFYSPWIENSGNVVIFNHTTGYYCEVEMKKSASWSTYLREVRGMVYNPQGKATYELKGVWNKEISVGTLDNDNKCSKFIRIWKENTVMDEERRQMYNMPVFAIQMNEHEKNVCPTDTRYRLDIQCLEKGENDKADEIKIKYENEQRKRRFEREQKSKEQGVNPTQPLPYYFEKKTHPTTKHTYYAPKGDYWADKANKTWKCPVDIFKI